MFTYPEQPETIGKILDSGFKLYKTSFKQIIIYSFLGALVGNLYSLIPISQDPNLIWNDMLKYAWTFPIIMIFTLLTYSIIIIRMHDIAIGVEQSVSAMFGRSLKKIVPLFIGSILYSFAIMIGTILLVVPGIYLMLALMFYAQIILLDKVSVFTALKRSYRLVAGNWWRTATVTMVPSFIFISVFMLVGFFAGFAEGFISPDESSDLIDYVMTAVTVLITTIISPLMYGFFLILLNDLKLRKQGDDLEARLEQ